MNKRNLIIAGFAAIAVIAGVRYKLHVDFWSFQESCQEAREARRDASKLLAGTIMNGYGEMAAEVTALIQDANDIIARCNASKI